MTRQHFFGTVLRHATAGGLVLSEHRYGPGTTLPTHTHPHPHVCLVVNGTFSEATKGREWVCRPATVLFRPGGWSHRDTFGPRGGRCFNIEAPDSWLNAASGRRVPSDLVCHGPGRASGLAGQMLTEFRRNDAYSMLAIEGLMLALLAELLRAGDREQAASAPPVWLARARELLEANVGRHIGLTELGTLVDVHPSHLARGFRRWTGMTVGEYERHLRLEYVRAELTRSQVALSLLAHQAGFADHSHLTRAFTRAYGVTPTRYRAQLQHSEPDPGRDATPVPER